jgi:hypothetical protein
MRSPTRDERVAQLPQLPEDAVPTTVSPKGSTISCRKVGFCLFLYLYTLKSIEGVFGTTCKIRYHSLNPYFKY